MHVCMYKGGSILVPKLPKIATRYRLSATKLEFWIFCEKSRQNEWS